MRKVYDPMLWLSRFPFSPPKTGRLLLRVSGAIIVAVLIAGGSLFSATHQAKAGGCTATGLIGPFVHSATTVNTFGASTVIDDAAALPVADCGSQYELIVTPYWNPHAARSSLDNHPIGVSYNPNYQPMLGPWIITNEDGAAMPLSAGFNVYFVPDVGWSNWIVSAGVYNVNSSEITSVDGYIWAINLSAYSDPSAHLIVTQNDQGASNPHMIGVWYDTILGEWTIYNEDKSSIPAGAEFNVVVLQGKGTFPGTLTLTATSANTSGSATCINSPLASDPTIFMWATHIYGGYNPGYFTDEAAAYINTSLNEWCVFDSSFNSMPLGAQFSVLLD